MLRFSSALAFFCLALAATKNVSGHETERGRPILEIFEPGDYHGHQQIYDIVQSTNGLIYFSNFGALMEYDGAAWRTIPVPTSWIRRLGAGENGRIWVGGADELGYVDPAANGTAAYHSLISQLPEGTAPLGAVGSVIWQEGSAWFVTDRLVLRWHDEKFQTWTFGEETHQHLRFGGKSLWLTRKGSGLYRWDGTDWTLVSMAEELRLNSVKAVVDDWTTGTTLLGTEDGRLWTMTADGAITAFAKDWSDNVRELRITDGRRLRNGMLALATHGEGVFVLDATGHPIERLSSEDGLSSSAYSVMEDRDGGVWVGTSMGAARVELNSPYTIFDRLNGRNASVVLALQRSNGVLYFGSDDGLQKLVVAEDDKTRIENVPGGDRRVFTLLAHEDGVLAGMETGLARVVDGQLKLEQRTPLAVLGLGRSRSEPARIFVGFPETVHSYLQIAPGQWRDEGPIRGFSGEARTLYEDRDGTLWVGTTQQGVARIKREAGLKWQAAQVTFYHTDRGLPPEPGWIRVVPGSDRPWFSTAQGAYVFDAQQNLFLRAPPFAATQRELAYTFPFVTMNDNELWAQVAASAEPRDLERPDVGRLTRTAAGPWQWQVLPPAIVNQVGYYGVYEMLAESNVLWLSGQKSIVRIETDQLATGAAPVATPFMWRRVSRSDVGALPLAGGETILPYSHLPLRFEFASPVFSGGRTVEYSHRLIGFDDMWSDWRERPEIEYTELPPGDYVLEVRTGAQKEAVGPAAAFAFRIKPLWYDSLIMRIIYGLAAAAAVFGLVRWRVGALRRNQVRLEQLVADRTRELRAATRLAETASQAKTMFLASMSHELRTPLHAILGYSQLLEANQSLDTGTRERLRVVGASGRHLLRLINEVLDLSKIEAGKQELRAEPFNLPALLAEVMDAQETQALAKQLTLVRPASAGLPDFVVGDASKLRQILENLVGNAVKFTVRGEVSLAVQRGEGGRLRFDVRDTGPGIGAEELRRLFQPFHQATSGGLAPEGTGLGLVITQRLIALMKGEIRVESTPGEGSHFWFELPLATMMPAVIAAVPRPAPAVVLHGRGRRVAVVDDVEANRGFLRDLLVAVDFNVTLFETAEAGLEALTRDPADLLVVDLRLPGMTGLEMTMRLRQSPATKKMPVIAASASVLNNDFRAALEAGCDDFISKPFLADDFMLKVGRLLNDCVPDAPEPETPAPVGPLAPGALRRIHAAAKEGDIVRMRDEVAALRAAGGGGALLDRIEQCVRACDADAVVVLTEETISP